MRITVFPHAINKDLDDRFLAPNMVRHKRNMRSGGSDSDNVGICENIRGNVKINNPYVNLVVDRYNIQVEPLPYEYGTATGGGSYLSGQTATVIATAGAGYEFVNWTEDGIEVSVDSEYSFAVTANRALIANFIDPIFYPNYGLLYNWYAATDSRLICADGWKVMSEAQAFALLDYIADDSTAGGKLKEVGLDHWQTPNDGATNYYGFNMRGAGVRRGDDGLFVLLNMHTNMITVTPYSTHYRSIEFDYKYDNIVRYIAPVKSLAGIIRPIKITTSLTHGQTGLYVGNNGLKYRTICINGVEYLADNLAETQFRNGEYIPGYDGGVYTPISNATWAAATTAMCCAYEDNLANV